MDILLHSERTRKETIVKHVTAGVVEYVAVTFTSITSTFYPRWSTFPALKHSSRAS